MPDNNITRCFIIVALLIIIYYFYTESELLGVTTNQDSFVSGAWEGDDGLYRARARAYQWCPPGGCENKKVEAKDLVSFNPFRWPNSGGYYFGTLNAISYDKPLFEKEGQEQDHATAET